MPLTGLHKAVRYKLKQAGNAHTVTFLLYRSCLYLRSQNMDSNLPPLPPFPK